MCVCVYLKRYTWTVRERKSQRERQSGGRIWELDGSLRSEVPREVVIQAECCNIFAARLFQLKLDNFYEFC